MPPKVSVILPVYNGGLYLKEAMESVLNQTFTDFELIIINDGSTDDSPKIIAKFYDSRIKIINQKNQGLIASLNTGIRLSKGKYIARMDADDISLPERFQKQIAHLDANDDIGLLGTTFAIQSEEKISGIAAVLLNDQDLRYQLLYKCPFGHGTVMFRKNLESKLDELWYLQSEKHVEDYELWSRMALITKIANLPDILYIWRDNPSGVSSKNRVNQKKKAKEIANRNQLCLNLFLRRHLTSTFYSRHKSELIQFQGISWKVNRNKNYGATLIHLSWIMIIRARFLYALIFLSRGALLTFSQSK